MTVDPAERWLPNHKMTPVQVLYVATDNCGTVQTLLSVTSNEPVDGTGGGDTSPDWDKVGTHDLRMRAERSGGGDGRIYTITITINAVDSEGDVATRSAVVGVPVSRGNP